MRDIYNFNLRVKISAKCNEIYFSRRALLSKPILKAFFLSCAYNMSSNVCNNSSMIRQKLMLNLHLQVILSRDHGCDKTSSLSNKTVDRKE